jgi:hypothetical protein
MAQTSAAPTEVERIAHYRELAVQFREWADSESNEKARVGLTGLARQYERLATELTARIDAVLAKRG